MSRTVLFSEVDEVAGRFPDYIAEIREVLLQAHLPESAEDVLPAIADRITTDEAFREDLASMLATVCTLEPGINHLEALGILVVAAVGTDQAHVLAEMPGVDLSARQLFNFVLETRRKRRNLAQEDEGSNSSERALPDAPGADAIRSTGQRTEPVSALDPEPASLAEPLSSAVRPVASAAEPKPLVTETAPGNYSMLARALALAADDELPGPVQVAAPAPAPVPEPRTLSTEPEEPATPARQRPRRVAPERPIEVPLPPRPVVPFAEALAEEEEDAPAPRRWGMWTAAACGVLLGFGIGIFAHFDHRTAPATTQPAAGGAGQAAVATTPGAAATPAHHMTLAEELRADLAIMGHHGPTQRSQAAREHARETERASAKSEGQTAQSKAAALNTAGSSPTARSASAANGGGSAGSGSASSSAGSSAPGPLVASVRPVNLLSAGDSAPRSAGAAGLPRVITGSAGMMAANLISSPAPAYPVAASAAGVQGEVIVEAVVGRDGVVRETRIVSGPMLLRAAALDAVQRWHYRPYEVDGKAVEVATTARLEFRLDH